MNQTNALIPNAFMKNYLQSIESSFASDRFVNTQINLNTTADYNHFLDLINTNFDYTLSGLITNYQNYGVSLSFFTEKHQLLYAFDTETASLIQVLISIAVVATIASFVQILVTMEIVFRTNIKLISLLRAFGYSDGWIVYRIFLIYFIFIFIGGLLSLTLAWLTSYFIYFKINCLNWNFYPFCFTI